MTAVVLTQNIEDIGEAIARALERIPLEPLVRGKLVAVNPNDTWATAATGLGGYVVETGLIIASTDALAADVVGAKLLGFGPQAVRQLWDSERLASARPTPTGWSSRR
jgi:hypothetical protein